MTIDISTAIASRNPKIHYLEIARLRALAREIKALRHAVRQSHTIMRDDGWRARVVLAEQEARALGVPFEGRDIAFLKLV